MGTIRPRKDGLGCSLCKAAEENVGKRRCCHMIVNGVPPIKVRTEGGINFVDITGIDNKSNSKVKIHGEMTEANIQKSILNLSDGLPKMNKKQKEAFLEDIRRKIDNL